MCLDLGLRGAVFSRFGIAPEVGSGFYAGNVSYTAYIGLGSNLVSPAGAPEATVRAAAQALAALGAVTALSAFYRTVPVGLREQPDFINAALSLEMDLAPEALLDELLAIERRFGRDRAASPPKGPRTLDLDLLMMTDGRGESMVSASPALTLPHPEIARRRFVLAPLAEIAPALLHPRLKRTISELLASLDASGEGGEVRRL